MDQPFGDLYHYMADALYAAARNHGVRILLSGFGGDMAASFKGKGYIAQLARMGRWLELIRLVRQRAAVEGGSSWGLLKGEVLGVLSPAFALRLYRLMRGKPVDGNGLSHLAIHPAFVGHIAVEKHWRQCGHSIENRKSPDPRTRMCIVISPANIAYLLEGMAISTAGFGLEHLHPLLDKRIIEFCLSLPTAQFVRNGWRRSLIRRAMEGVLPPNIQWRTTKFAFSPDYHSRMLSAKPQVLRFLAETEANYRTHPYVDRSKIERQLKKVRPIKGCNQWEGSTQMIVGRGMEIESYVRWFNQKVDQKTTKQEQREGGIK